MIKPLQCPRSGETEAAAGISTSVMLWIGRSVIERQPFICLCTASQKNDISDVPTLVWQRHLSTLLLKVTPITNKDKTVTSGAQCVGMLDGQS
jgi:hypothetical protein